MTRDDLIEAMARAAYDAEWGHGSYDADRTSPFERETMTTQMTDVLSAIEALGVVVVPEKATGAMIERGVNYRLKTSIDMHNRWPDDTANIWSAMIAANPLAQNPEQG